jgi:hypothetical protein
VSAPLVRKSQCSTSLDARTGGAEHVIEHAHQLEPITSGLIGTF